MNLKAFFICLIPSLILLAKIWVWILGVPMGMDGDHMGGTIVFTLVNVGLAVFVGCHTPKSHRKGSDY